MRDKQEDVLRLLAQVGCDPRNVSGAKTFKCPECSHLRKPGNQRRKCLSVKTDSQGFQFCCHNCDFKGGFFHQESRPPNRKPQTVRKSNSKTAIGSYYR